MRRKWQRYEPEHRGIASSITENELLCMSELVQRRRERSHTAQNNVTKYSNAKNINWTTWQQAWKEKSSKGFNAFWFSDTIAPNWIQTTSSWRKSCHVLPAHSSHSTGYDPAFFSDFKNMCLCEWWQTQRNKYCNRFLDCEFGICINIKMILNSHWFIW